MDQVRTDIRDSVVIWSDLSLRAAQPADVASVRDESITLLAEAVDLLGSDPLLDRERSNLIETKRAAVAGAPAAVREASEPPRDHRVLGRSMLRSGDLTAAVAAFDAELAERPGDFWSHFYLGTCYYRLRDWDSALAHFSRLRVRRRILPSASSIGGPSMTVPADPNRQ